jgi:hypothetical protein
MISFLQRSARAIDQAFPISNSVNNKTAMAKTYFATVPKPKNVWHFAKKAGFIRDLRAGRKKSQAAPMLPEQVARVPDPSGKETAASGSPPQGSGSFNEPQTQTQGAQWSVLGEATAQNPVVPASEWIPEDELPRYSEGGDDLNRKEAKELVKGALEGEPNVQYYEGLLNSSLAEYIAEEFESRTGNRALLSGLALRHIAAYNTARDNTDGTSPFHQFQSQPKQPLWEEAVGSQTVGSIGGSSSFTGGLGGLRVEGRPGVGWQGQDPNAPSWDASDFRTYATHASSHLQSVPAAWTPRTGYTQPYSERQEGPRSPTSVQWNEEEKPDQGNDPQYGAADNFATGPSTAITSSYAPSRGWYTGSRGYGTGQPSGDFPSMDQSVPTSTFEQSRAKFFPASRAAQVYGGASVYQEPTGTSGHQKPQTFESSGYSEEQQVTYPEQGQEYHSETALREEDAQSIASFDSNGPATAPDPDGVRWQRHHHPGRYNDLGELFTWRSEQAPPTSVAVQNALVAGSDQPYPSDSRGQKRHRSKHENTPKESITDKVAKTARGMFKGRSG